MIWATLAILGVPLWLCALGILILLLQNRKLRKRYGDVPVRVRRSGKKRWRRGHAVWVSDVFAWRGSPAARDEDLCHVSELTRRAADPEERKKLRHLTDNPTIVTLAASDGDHLDVAAAPEFGEALLGPFTAHADA